LIQATLYLTKDILELGHPQAELCRGWEHRRRNQFKKTSFMKQAFSSRIKILRGWIISIMRPLIQEYQTSTSHLRRWKILLSSMDSSRPMKHLEGCLSFSITIPLILTIKAKIVQYHQRRAQIVWVGYFKMRKGETNLRLKWSYRKRWKSSSKN
jgi:hypothetical protein